MTDADLIKALRQCCAPWERDDSCPCEDCTVPYKKRGTDLHDMCDDYIMRLAADRLEELTERRAKRWKRKLH